MARKQRRRIASRGSVNTIILKSLVGGDKYGYEIIKDVEKYSDGAIKLKQPSLYSSLSRFEEKGIVSSYWGDSDIGGRRHYYHLTENGYKYYQREVLKIKDEIVEDDKPLNTEVVIKNDIEVGNVDETNISTDDTKEEIILKELPENSIPASFNFETKPKEEIIPDHVFYTQTPIEKSEITIESNIPKIDPWKELSNKVKRSNKAIANSPNKKLIYKKPMKSRVVILDRDGIYKLRDSDYKEHTVSVQKSKIIDNVIKRTNHTPAYPYYTENKNTQVNHEYTEEEKRQRNENFLAKFNKLTEDKMLQKSLTEKPAPAPTPKPIEEEKIDYRSKLDKLIMSEDIIEEKIIDNTDEISNVENKIFEYDDDTQEDEDKFVDFEPTEFETKVSNSKYIEEINNYTTDEPVQISKYESRNTYVEKDRSYVLINKVKLTFGIILLLLLALEITVSFVVFNKLNLIGNGDKTFIIVSYILSLILSLCYILPFIFHSNAHKLNTFKYKYSILLGILTFLVLTVLIYCINALNGFEIDNFKYFAVKLILPMILSFNFVICPPIYGAIINSKRFYD
ncbi:MAG: PadR family transcriptional regulator [Clostridiales bacterium]|nr:PadR family transcriptional regulator [Clostridiales bacterium]